MALHALGAIDDALKATRKYRPRGLGQWLWVALVALFVGSPGLSLPSGGGGGGTAQQPGGGEMPQQFDGGAVPEVGTELLLGVAVAIAVVWLFFAVVGALLEFPFLRWLRDGEASVGTAVADHGRQALGLAVFRVVVGAVGFVPLLAVVLWQVGTSGTLFEYIEALSGVAFLVGLVSFPVSVVAGFTTAFVVPTMMLENVGVVGGWRRFWGTLTGAPKQFAVYAVAVLVLGYVGGIVIVIAALLALILGLLVGGILGLVAATAGSTMAGVVVAAAVGGLAVTVAVLVTYALFQIYLRYYALLVLGDVDDGLDYIPGRRREVRGGPEERADPTDPAGDDPQFSS